MELGKFCVGKKFGTVNSGTSTGTLQLSNSMIENLNISCGGITSAWFSQPPDTFVRREALQDVRGCLT